MGLGLHEPGLGSCNLYDRMLPSIQLASFNIQKKAKERNDNQMVIPQRIQSNLNSAILVTFSNLKRMLLLLWCGSHPKQDGIRKWTPSQLRYLHLEHFDWGIYGLALDDALGFELGLGIVGLVRHPPSQLFHRGTARELKTGSSLGLT